MLAALLSALTTLVIYVSLLLVGFWIWFQWSHRDLLRVAAKLPVIIPTVPFLGHAYLVFHGIEETGRRMLELGVNGVSKGIRTVCLWAGPLPFIHIGEVEDIQIMLNTTRADKPDEYDFFSYGLDLGVVSFRSDLLSANGQVWKIMRKHMNPMFHPQNIQLMAPTFNTNSRELVARMHEHVGRGPFNVMEYTMDVALKTVCNLIFGPDTDINVKSDSFRGLNEVVEQIPETFLKRLWQPWLRIDWLYRLLYRSKIKRLNTNWKNFTEPMLKKIKERRMQKTNDESKSQTSSNENQAHGTTGLINLEEAFSVLRQRYPQFTEADMLVQIVVLYCTGTDTVGSGTASCLLALAQYQDVQERLYEEIVSVVGHQDDVSLEDLSNMPYLDQVIKETLRKFLIVPYVMRKVTQDVQLRNLTIPAGSAVICNLASVHMDPEIYKNPDKFDPERFSPENSSGKGKFTYLPFSGGPRVCIAKNYATQLMKIQIIHVIRRFKLTTNQDINNLKKKLIITLVSSEGYNICVEKRLLHKTLEDSD